MHMSKNSIKTIITFGNGIIVLALILIFVIQHTSKMLEQNEVNSRSQAKELTKAILSIQKMSDDMTNMTRSYIFTGDDKYKKILVNLADFISPDAPWPLHYHSYLSHVESNLNYSPQKGNVFKIIDHFEDLNANEYEISLLAEIKDISNILHQYELDIIKIYESGGTQHSISMINSNFYLSWKSELARKIASLDSIINYRLNLQNESKSYTQSILTTASCLLTLLLILFFVIYYRRTKNLIISNISTLSDWSNEISEGKYNVELNQKVLNELEPIKRSISNLSQNTSRLVVELQEIAEQDELTRMPNRRAAINFLKQKQQEVSRYYSLCSIIIIDIDYFKKVNDTYGHPVGDDVLINVGHIISKYSRDSDYAARLGGEEFMVIAPQTDLSSAYILANKLKTKVASYLHQSGQHQIQVTISSGVSTLVADGSVEQSYKQADEALYLAKELGRNNVQIYSPPAVNKSQAPQKGTLKSFSSNSKPLC